MTQKLLTLSAGGVVTETANSAWFSGTALSATTGAFSGALATSDATASTSTITGSLKAAGGLGVVGDTFLGGKLGVNAGTFFTGVDGGAIFSVVGAANSAYFNANSSQPLTLRTVEAATAGVTAKNSLALRWYGNRWTGTASSALQATAMMVPSATIDSSRLAFGFTDNNGDMLNLTHGSRLGILTTNPQQTLDVNGAVGINGTQILDVNRNLTVVTIKIVPVAVASLPAGATGMRAFVNDALAPVFGAAVAGGGAVTVPVYHDGTNWKVG